MHIKSSWRDVRFVCLLLPGCKAWTRTPRRHCASATAARGCGSGFSARPMQKEKRSGRRRRVNRVEKNPNMYAERERERGHARLRDSARVATHQQRQVCVCVNERRAVAFGVGLCMYRGPDGFVELHVDAHVLGAHGLLRKRLDGAHGPRRALLEGGLVQQLRQVDGGLTGHLHTITRTRARVRKEMGNSERETLDGTYTRYFFGALGWGSALSAAHQRPRRRSASTHTAREKERAGRGCSPDPTFLHPWPF